MNNNPLLQIPDDNDPVGQVFAADTIADNAELLKEVLKYGDVPILYRPTKQMLQKPSDPGLSQLIENSMSVNEVNNLLNKGILDYKNASPKTIKKWKRSAEKRIAELSK